MDLSFCLSELKTNATAIEKYLAGVDDTQAHWKPSEKDWSLCEVINHLLDEERHDFPFRIRHLLSGNPGEWPPIYPARWVTERKYNERNFQQSLQAFLEERKNNLAWAEALKDMDWAVKYQHEPLAGLSAGDLMVSWAAHDLLHIRQLNEIKYAYGVSHAAPFSPGYAGDW
jgi:hypothetical protein